MKKKILFCLLFFLMGITSNAQESNRKTFEFPIKPNDGKWEKITSIGQRLELLQIPNNILTEIPTPELLDICLDFPYLIDILFSDNYQSGFECLKKEFNGYKELLHRKDLLYSIITKNKTLLEEVQTIQKQRSLDKGRFAFKWFVLGMIAAQDELLRQMDFSYIRQEIKNLKIKRMYPDLFGDSNSVPTYLLFAKYLVYSKTDMDGEIKEKLEYYINEPSYLGVTLMNDIDNLIEKD